MSKVDIDKNSKANKVLRQVFEKNASTLKNVHVRDKIIEYIQTEIMSEDDNENLAYKIAVDDLDKMQWRRNEHFMKIFWFEIDHLEEYYSLSDTGKNLLLNLGRYLMWETNLLVDEENEPLNQKTLAQKLGKDERTLRRNMKELINKYIVHQVEFGKDSYYIVNPYVMFVGQNINKSIPKLFEELGYVDSNTLNKQGRSNRRKEKETLITLGS